jgi:hypothetical protein
VRDSLELLGHPSGLGIDTLINCGLQLKRRTYAAAARAMSEAIKESMAVS